MVVIGERRIRSRIGHDDDDYPQGPELCRLHAAAMAVNARELTNIESLSGPQVGQALHRARIAAIGAARTLRV